MTNIERVLYSLSTAGCCAIATWLLYKTWGFGKYFNWNSMPSSEATLTRMGRIGLYLFLIPVALVFGALAAMLAINRSSQWIGPLATLSTITSLAGITISLICGMLLKKGRREENGDSSN